MANFTYADYESRQKRSTAPKKDFKKVGYFTSLRNDGDDVIVRFDYDTQDDFEVVTVHSVKVRINDRDLFRSISCLKQKAYDADDVCPLCKSGNKAKYKTYIKMLEYVKDDAGNICPSAACWERPSMFIKDIVVAAKDAIDNGFYSAGTPIRDMVFKIRRNGAKGSRETSYRVSALNPTVFPSTLYKADFTGLEGFDASRHSYMVKSLEDMETYLKTGDFPAPVKDVDAEDINLKDLPNTSAPVADSVVKTSTPSTEEPVAVDRPKRTTWSF